MNIFKARASRVVIAAGLACGLVALAAEPAGATTLVSQATAQAVNLNLGSLGSVAVSNPATTASNDGTGSNTPVNASPLISLLGTEKFLGVGALQETAEANQNGSSYACAGTVSPTAMIQVGGTGTTCSITGSGSGGVTIDLGELFPTLKVTTLGQDIKITVDGVTAHAYDSGSGTPERDATVANVEVQLGSKTTPVVIPSDPNEDLLAAVLDVLKLGPLGTAISNLLKPLITLTSNYQPAPVNGTYSVSGIHIELLGGNLATADISKATVGPNIPNLPTSAFSFGELPFIMGGLALLLVIGFGVRTGVRRVRQAL